MFISLAINPTTYIVIFLLLGVVLKSKRWKRLCLTLSALLFLLFSNGALYQWIAEQWYKEYDRPYLKGNNIHTASCWAATAIGTGNEADPNLARLPTYY